MSNLSVSNGQTVTTTTLIGGADTITVALGGVINVSTAAPDLNWSSASTGLTITNDGTITQTGTGANARPAIGISNVASLTGVVTIVNTGTISSAAGIGIFFGTAPGQENITTSGSIVGGNGIAIQFGSGDDTLTLQSGYSITGRVIGGAGNNTLNLSGAGGGSFRGASEGINGSTATFAGFENFNTLNVQSGAWSLYGGGYYDTINITAGATLIVDEANAAAHGNPSDGGIGPIGSTLTINNNGTLKLLNPAAPTTLVIDYDPNTPENSATGPIVLAGTGSVQFSGYFVVEPNAAYTIAGGVTALDGTVLVLGSVTADLTVNNGAVVQLGYGGGQLHNNAGSGSTYTDTGTSGSVTGSIVDNGLLIYNRLDAFAFTGALTGSGALEKLGAGTLTLANSTNFSGQITANGGTLNLAGTIHFTGGAPAVSSLNLGATGPTTIANAGTLISDNSAAINMITAPGNVTLVNSGTISGGTQLSVNNQAGVILSNHNDSLTNTGVINGYVWLAGGTDTLDSHLGTINGAVITGVGSDTILLGAEDNIVAFGAGTHVVDGGGGINTAAYGGATAGVSVSLALQNQAQNTGAGTDTLTHFQTLIGSNYGDLLGAASTGASTLTGGTGADIFRVTTALTGAATVSDFSQAQGDKIDLGAFGSLRAFSDVVAAAQQVGSDTVITLGTGTLTLTGITLANLTASDFVLPLAAHASFDLTGDHRSDLLFRNPASGDWGYAAMTATGFSWRDIGVTSAAYAIDGTGDFNGDGVADILFHNHVSGDWGFAAMTASGGVAWHGVGVTSAAYSIDATGDFNGDGVADILFRNHATGDWGFAALDRNGGLVWNDKGVTTLTYSIDGTGDFNGDGVADVLLRNHSTGDWGFAALDRNGGVSWNDIGITSTAYPIAGLGDFNGDGTTDVLFRNPATGDWGYMAMHRSGAPTWVALGASTTSYAIDGTGDFNGDGTADVVFRNHDSGDWGWAAMHPNGSFDWNAMGASNPAYFVG